MEPPTKWKKYLAKFSITSSENFIYDLIKGITKTNRPKVSNLKLTHIFMYLDKVELISFSSHLALKKLLNSIRNIFTHDIPKLLK